MIAIGPRLAFLRTQRGFTQVGLSQRTGIPQANLSKIERGLQDPTVSTFLRICSALDVSPARVLQEEPERASLRWTRSFLERIARAVVGLEEARPQEEREIVELLRDVLVSRRAKRLSSRRVYQSWSELKRRFTEEEIKTLAERVQDADERREAGKKSRR
jgi:transcriptional regulator with XRE-family HTH domain